MTISASLRGAALLCACALGLGLLPGNVMAQECISSAGAVNASGQGYDLACGPDSEARSFDIVEGVYRLADFNQLEASIAIGQFAWAAGSDTTAVGSAALAGYLEYAGTLEIDGVTYYRHALRAVEGASAFGASAHARASYSTALGTGSVSGDAYGVALGFEASSAGEGAMALGSRANAVAAGAVAIGADSVASETGTVSFGNDNMQRRLVNIADGIADSDAATVRQLDLVAASAEANSAELAYFAVNGSEGSASASGTEAMAMGQDASAAGYRASAIGFGTSAGGTQSFAAGTGAAANGNYASAVGFGTVASGQLSSAVGYGAQALASDATALGRGAQAQKFAATAVGSQASASRGQSTAIGYLAQANQSQATAVGAQAQSNHTNSTAVGFKATTTADNQVMLGGAGSSVVIADIDASTAAQTGPVDVVTVDANGVLGRQAVASQASMDLGFDKLRSQMDAISAVTDAQFASLSSNVAALDGRVGVLEQGFADLGFRLEDYNRSAMGGIAAATALGSAIAMPDKQFTISGNLATHGGQQGYAASFTGRMSESFAIGAGLAGNTADSEVTAQVGFALGF